MRDQSPEARTLIGERVREARRLAGLSQAQLAQLLGLHRPSVSELEAGHRRVSAEELKRLSELLDVSVTWLLGEASNQLDPRDPRVRLAARELSKLKPGDLDKLLGLLAKMRDEQ